MAPERERTEEGGPLVAAPCMIRLRKGYLAAAQTLYPVTICHCLFMANHVHLIIKVDIPENLPRFCEYFKRESAHADREQIFQTRARARSEVFNYIEGFDNTVRTHSALGYRSPVEFELEARSA